MLHKGLVLDEDEVLHYLLPLKSDVTDQNLRLDQLHLHTIVVELREVVSQHKLEGKMALVSNYRNRNTKLLCLITIEK